MSNRKQWHWRCGCGTWGSGSQHNAIRDADSHAADTGHVVVYWRRGHRLYAEAWEFVGPGMRRAELPDWWKARRR